MGEAKSPREPLGDREGRGVISLGGYKPSLLLMGNGIFALSGRIDTYPGVRYTTHVISLEL